MPYTNLFYSFSLPPHTSTENMEILLYGDVSNSRIEFSLCFSFLLAFSCADKCKFRVPTRKYVGSLWRFEYRCWLSYETGFSYQNIHKKVFNGYDLFMLWKIGIYTITWTYWWWQVSKLLQGSNFVKVIGLRLHSRNDPNESLKIIWKEQNGLLKPLSWLFRPRSNRTKIGLALFGGH